MVSPSPQNKELKSRLASAEGLQRPSGHVPQLEARVQELQERLQAEERYRPPCPPCPLCPPEPSASPGPTQPMVCRREKSTLLSSNRKLERKVKELSIQIEDERQHVSDQKDQVGDMGTPRGP